MDRTDRGQLGNSAIVRFDRSGPRVLLVAPNYRFRANSNNPDERLAVKDAFAESTLWGFEVVAEEEGYSEEAQGWYVEFLSAGIVVRALADLLTVDGGKEEDDDENSDDDDDDDA